MNVAAPPTPAELHLDPRGVESTGLRARLMTRVRGEQTLKRLRKLGLRAQPPIRLAGRAFIDPEFAWAVEIGSHTIIANDVRIIAHDAAIKRLTGYTEVRAVTIGRRCYIGAGAIILPGAVIGDEAIIGAGALVRGEIPPGCLAVGNPAKVIGEVAELAKRHLEWMETCPCFDQRPRDLDSSNFAEMQRSLLEHGHLYLL